MRCLWGTVSKLRTARSRSNEGGGPSSRFTTGQERGTDVGLNPGRGFGGFGSCCILRVARAIGAGALTRVGGEPAANTIDRRHGDQAEVADSQKPARPSCAGSVQTSRQSLDHRTGRQRTETRCRGWQRAWLKDPGEKSSLSRRWHLARALNLPVGDRSRHQRARGKRWRGGRFGRWCLVLPCA
jgi:hypothetical protein